MKGPYVRGPETPGLTYASREPMRVLVGVNPKAAGGKGSRYRDALELHIRRTGGTLRMPPHIAAYDSFETHSDPLRRIEDIQTELRRFRPDVVVGAGGDGTIADFALAMEGMDAPHPYLLAGPVGTAFDIARCSGVPKKAAWLFDWLRYAGRFPFPVGHVRFNGGDRAYPMVHSLSIGLSGEVFAAMEEAKREHPGLPSWRYLGILAPRITHAPSYDLQVSDGVTASPWLRSGETVVSLLPRIMGTAGVVLPVPLYGLGVYVLPVHDEVRDQFAGPIRRVWPAVRTLLEGLIRGLKVATTDTSLVHDLSPVASLDRGRQPLFPSGAHIRMQLAEPGSNGAEPKGIHVALNGETLPEVGPVHQVDIDLPVPTLETLAHQFSYFDMRGQLMRSGALLAAGGSSTG